jgi:muramoyltetrapeptide carboxypeptidase
MKLKAKREKFSPLIIYSLHMHRKHFLSSVFATGAALTAKTIPQAGFDKFELPFTVPRYLQRGDTIGITCPAGFYSVDKIQPSILQMQNWGMKIRLGDTVGKKDGSFGGTDEERKKDMQKMLDDPDIKAIMCARGGYGITRIIDQLDFSKFKIKPKWIVGFSDITALLVHIDKNYQIASIHSKMCNSFPDVWETAEPVVQETIESIRRVLTGSKMVYSALPQANNRNGVAEGTLIGGNLSVIQNLMGTKSEINTDGKILFLEEVGEYLYSLDRMLTNLKRAGKLNKLKALVVGGFNKIKPDDPGEEFGRSLYQIVMEKVEGTSYPICFDFPVGHQKNNFALKCGVKHLFTVRNDVVELKEI